MSKSQSIAKRLVEQEEWKHADTIGITISMNHEVYTRPLIELAWLQGKKVAVPKCDRETHTLTFRYITSFKQLEIVYMNLEEPNPSVTEVAYSQDIPLLFVPGVAFTKKGDRLGYGGGYYDRYLSTHKGNTISLAYSEQIVSYVPTGPYDQQVQKLITDLETICCSYRKDSLN